MKNSTLLFIVLAIFSSCRKEKKSDKAGLKMQEFVIEISNYAKGLDSDFIVIPQNGVELLFNYLAEEDGLNDSYLAAIDGVGIEELFYNGELLVSDERLGMLRKLPDSKPVLVAEYVTDNANVTDAISRNQQEGFLCFPRVTTNYDYNQIPDSAINENSDDVFNLSDAKNYLYLISSEGYANKEEFINAIVATNFDVVLIDLFYGDVSFSLSEVAQLKIKANGGKRLVISYMNIGAAESYRYYWNSKWKLHRPNWLKKAYDGYEDEIWVKFWKKDWQEIIYGNDDCYTKKIIDSGFDGVYLDNVEAYYFLYFE